MIQKDQYRESCPNCSKQYDVTKTTQLEDITLNNKLHQIYCPHCDAIQPFFIIASKVTSSVDEREQQSKILINDIDLPYKAFRDRANKMIKEEMQKRNNY